MDGTIRLSPSDRKALLQHYRSGTGLSSRRAHVILLVAEGWTLRALRSALFVSFDFILRTVRTFQQQGLNALAPTGTVPPALPRWASRGVELLKTQTPEDFGYFRRRWSCETVAEVLASPSTHCRSGRSGPHGETPCESAVAEDLARQRDRRLSGRSRSPFEPQSRLLLDETWISNASRHPGQQREAAPRRIARLADRHPRGQPAGAAAEHRSLRRPSRRPPDSLLLRLQNSLHLRQCRVPLQPTGQGLRGTMGSSARGPLPAEVCRRNQPH